MRIIIIGGGLFGEIIATGLRAAGHYPMILDCNKPDYGSGPAACLMNPVWAKGLGPGVFETAIEFLYKHYPVLHTKLLQPGKNGVKEVDCLRVHPDHILGQNRPAWHFEVTTPPDFDGEEWCVTGDLKRDELHKDYMTLKAEAVIVAAGIWSQALVPKYNLGLSARGGSALFFSPKDVPPEAGGFIIPWAPFKQVVGFQRGDGFWVGDGTAKKHHTEIDLQATRQRCLQVIKTDPHVSASATPTQLFGWRPYVKAKPCFLQEVEPRLWVATGAAKSGTLLGAWCATKLVEALS
jgi:glycine/D-amino acid oxidase-like deaminating enzyme